MLRLKLYFSRNWSLLSLKIYIFLTLEFTAPYFNFHQLTASLIYQILYLNTLKVLFTLG